ncbi:lipoxygenase family protein [Kangiella sp. TOML190]|uniref:lipoxygenase family protein n=1 Tax=Kangiella sp. TOML190 TaxID=2931351 RepID=UPI00203BACC9|nr:lipoxygenase family protein [Kangiella sp. TOML190]
MSIQDDLKESSLDLYTKLFSESTIALAETHVKRNAEDAKRPHFEPKPQAKLAVAPPFILIPENDENHDKDWTEKFASEALAHGMENLPVEDVINDWPSREEAIESAYELYKDKVPKIIVDWKNPTSDEAFTHLVFQGIGAHRLERAKSSNKDAEFMVDLSWMQAYPVREKYEKYGSIAYFGADRKPVGIFEPKQDKMIRPGDKGWEGAKWRFRSSLFTAVTLTDHLGYTHYLVSNTLTTVTIEQLSTDHPLRYLLTPFIFGAADINREAYFTLSNKGGIAHRCFAMEHEGVLRCVLKGVEAATLETFEESMVRRGVDGLGEDYPYGEDGLKLVKIMEQLADEYMSVYYDGDDLVNDPHIKAWWSAINRQAPNLEIGKLETRDCFLRLLSHFMFVVTGYHGQVGNIAQYTLDPTFIGTKLRGDLEEQEISDLQSHAQMVTLTITTGLGQPHLMENFDHILSKDKTDSAINVFKTYRGRLKALSEDIKALNTQRSLPLETFNPEVLTSSVST